MGYYSEVMQRNLNHSYELIKLLLSDLADDDLLIRPVPQGNHTAWELGHLIAREYRIGSQYFGVEFSELPTGFQEQHGEATARAESAVGFLSKASPQLPVILFSIALKSLVGYVVLAIAVGLWPVFFERQFVVALGWSERLLHFAH